MLHQMLLESLYNKLSELGSKIYEFEMSVVLMAISGEYRDDDLRIEFVITIRDDTITLLKSRLDVLIFNNYPTTDFCISDPDFHISLVIDRMLEE